MAPAFAQFEQKYASKLNIVNVNVDDATLREKYKAFKESQYIPETVILKDGKAVFRKTGSMTLDDLEKAVAEASKG